MNETDKNYILKSIINNDFVASETASIISYKLVNEYPINQLEKSLLILVIEYDPDLIKDYKEMLIEIVKKYQKRNEQHEKN